MTELRSRPLAVCAEQASESHGPAKSADLVAQAVTAQQVAHAAVRADDAERDAVSPKVAVQLMQGARAGEIDEGRCRQFTDHPTDLRGTGRSKPAKHRFQDRILSKVKER